MSNWNNRLVGALAIAALVLGMGSLNGPTTRAVFNDQAGSSSNTFTAGTIDLTLAGAAGDITDTVEFTANMIPGDKVAGPAAGLAVKNNGATSRELRYAVTSKVNAAGEDVLGKRLDLIIGKRATTGTCDATTPATFGTTEAGAADWIIVYQGDLARATTEGNLIGNPTTGSHAAVVGDQQSGDRVLTTNQTEYLCFRVDFANSQDKAAGTGATGAAGNTDDLYTQDDATAAEDNTYKSATANIVFTFYAEQTGN